MTKAQLQFLVDKHSSFENSVEKTALLVIEEARHRGAKIGEDKFGSLTVDGISIVVGCEIALIEPKSSNAEADK